MAVEKVIAELPAATWQRLSCGRSKGPREYDWVWIELVSEQQNGWGRWLLARRKLSDPTKIAYFMVFASSGTSMPEAVRVAGTRWSIEMGFEITKDELGLDHYEVRSAASLVSTHHTGTVGSRCAICHSCPSSNYGRSIGGQQRTETIAVDIARSQAAIMAITLVYLAPRSSLSGIGQYGDDESKSEHGSATIDDDTHNAHDRVNSYRLPPMLNTRPIQPI